MKRHEFVMAGQEDAVFVVFTGHEDTPFWRREGDGIRFVYTNLSFSAARALSEMPDSRLAHSTSDTTEEEFNRYYNEATEKHKGL